jgi:hypothetical protein
VKLISRLCSVVLVGLLGACDQEPSVVVEYQASGPVWPHIVAAVKDNGAVLVELQGDPFDEGMDTVAGNVLGSMSQTIGDRTVTFTTDPTRVSNHDIRVIVLLGTPDGMKRKGLCQGRTISDETLEKAEAGARLRTLGVLCINGDLRVRVRGWVNDATATTDQKFKMLMQQTAREMLKNKKK